MSLTRCAIQRLHAASHNRTEDRSLFPASDPAFRFPSIRSSISHWNHLHWSLHERENQIPLKLRHLHRSLLASQSISVRSIFNLFLSSFWAQIAETHPLVHLHLSENTSSMRQHRLNWKRALLVSACSTVDQRSATTLSNWLVDLQSAISDANIKQIKLLNLFH